MRKGLLCTSENLSRGSERMGAAERKATGYLADATTAESLHAAWKEARVAIRHPADVEKAVIRSSGVLYAAPDAAPQRLAGIEAAIDKEGAALVDEARAAYVLHAQRLGTQPVFEPPMTAEVSILLGKHLTALQIHDFLSSEFEPMPLSDVKAVLRARESGGTIRLVRR